jgi:hypothetical protein
MDYIKEHLDKICSYISSKDTNTKISLLNEVRERLHSISPFKNEPS